MAQMKRNAQLFAGCAIHALIFLSVGASAAHAQTAALPPAASTDRTTLQEPSVSPDGQVPAATLDDIIVTARKRNERLRDVPVALTAVTGERLTERNITQLVDLVTTLPNLTVSYGTVQPRTFIRGFGSGDNLSFDQSVGKFVDKYPCGEGRLAG